VEHLTHSPDCGWAIVATIESQDGVLSLENPATKRMMEARKATFADKWPHEGKKGWKCKTKQVRARAFVEVINLSDANDRWWMLVGNTRPHLRVMIWRRAHTAN